MMKFKITVLIVLFTMSFGIEDSNGQLIKLQENYPQLKVGDKVPDYTLTNLINYPTRTAKLTDFHGKLVILDFWHSGCASCIEAWPKLQSLQEEFKDSLQIILINPTQERATVEKLIQRRKRAGVVDLKLPVVCEDTVLLELFPYSAVPHIVWINKDGLIKSITGGEAVNSKNIRSLLNNKVTNMVQKSVPMQHVDFTKPLFIQNNGNSNQPFLWRSILTGYVEQLRSSDGVMSSKEFGYYIMTTNYSILDMYRFAYSNFYSDRRYKSTLNRLPRSRVSLNVKDLTKYELEKNEVDPQNMYVYQLTAGRPSTVDELQAMMQADLNRYFGLSVKWERRKTKCLVLSAMDTSYLQYKGGNYEFLINDAEISLNYITIPQILLKLELNTKYYFSPYPILDETGYSGKIGTIKFETNVYDYVALDKALQKYKMRFTLEDREIDILVISESNSIPEDHRAN